MPAWDEEDQLELAKFLTSTTGQRLKQALIATIADQNERAVAEGTPAACGRAQGYRTFWALWEHLSSNYAERPADGLQYASAGYHGPLADLAHLSP